ncbi:MAG: neuraminidase-like domain-containing protein [Acidobacteriota bacterium]
MANSSNSPYTLNGRVTDQRGEPLEGLTVRAYDKDTLSADDFLGEARTDADGRYRISFTEEQFRPSVLEVGGPDVYIRVFDGDRMLGESQAESCAENQVTIDLQVQRDSRVGRGSGAGRPAADTEARYVSGVVRDARGNLLPNILVIAIDRDLRREQELGQATTDERGFYRIKYFTSDFIRTEKGSADLVVKVRSPALGERAFASPVLFNAPPDATVDVTIPAELLPPLDLFQKIRRELTPLLGDAKVDQLQEDTLRQEPREELRHRDVSFAAGETGLDKKEVARFVLAHKLTMYVGLPEKFWFALLGSSIYRFDEERSLGEQLKAVLDALPTLDADAVRKAIHIAFNRRDISGYLTAELNALIEEFLTLVARRTVSDEEGSTFFKAALEDAGVKTTERQEKVARLFGEHGGLTPELLEKLKQDRSFKPKEIADLRTSFELAELTRGDFSVVKTLKEEFGVREPEQIRTLARKSEAEWVSLVTAKHDAGDIKLPFEVGRLADEVKPPEAEVYGRTLARRFREAFPTAAFAGGLDRAAQEGGARGLRHAETLGRFLAGHENFELLNTPVDEFLERHARPEFRESAQDKSFRQEVKAVQRVFKLAPTFEATDELLADDLRSAQQVYRLGESEFVRRYARRPGFTEESARRAWNRAADTHAAAVTIVTDLKALEAEALPEALKNGDEALKQFPNWNNLFKAGDLCECEHCRSVLSPAAYFADLLMFLKDRNAENGQTVKDLLLTRRPDLGFIELSCDNALVPLPYIDVVCEVLEDVIDKDDENDLQLTGFNAIPADPAAARAAVAQALADALADPANHGKERIPLGDDFSLSRIDHPAPTADEWVAHGEDVTYLLKKAAPASDFAAKILRNTKASADELRAYPQYVNPKAYAKLREAKYPLTLPFDLFAEEVRAAFQKTNLQRWDLMRTLRGPAPNNPTDGEIAAEYFGISAPDEIELILVADTTVGGQREVWGETGGGWLAAVGNVKNFLRKTGLEYNDLLALLDLKFINPDGDIVVNHLDDSCDTEQKVIQVLNPTRLDRIHRFLRLWRKLKGWKMWELDLVIRHPRIGGGALDEPFLINLFYFSLLRNRLGKKATVEHACALFGDINTETRFTNLHKKRENALYQNLFLNRRFFKPLDTAFELDPATGDLGPVIDPSTGAPVIDPDSGLPAPHRLTDEHLVLDPVTLTTTPAPADHRSVIMAALGIGEADLTTYAGLTRASDGAPYIDDALTLANLSFIWRHAWLAKLLKFKAEEWKTLLKLSQQDIDEFGDPQAAWEFVQTADRIKAAGFTPDELSWLLAADRASKAAPKEADAARLLAALRNELQAIRAEHVTAQLDSLTPDGLTTLLTTLLQKLNRDEAAAQLFVSALRGQVILEATAAGLSPDFAFPANVNGAPNNIPVRSDPALHFSGALTEAQREVLLNDASLAAVTGLPAYQQAVDELFQWPGRAIVAGLPAGFSFPEEITDFPNFIPILYAPVLRFTGLMSEAQRATLLAEAAPADPAELTAFEQAVEELFQQSESASANYLSLEVEAALPGGVTLPPDRPSIPIHYNPATQRLGFVGVMTEDERAALVTAGNPADAINELFRVPRLAVKFFEPVFEAPLELLPAAVDFNAQLSADLAPKISYDAEQRLLRFAGIMSGAERALLHALVPNVPAEAAYHNAVDSLGDQPAAIVATDERVWLTDADLDASQAANDTFPKRLANAAGKALAYLSKTLSEKAVVRQSAAATGLTEAVTRRLLTNYPVLPDTLLAHLTGAFAATTGAVDYASMKTTFDGWFWLGRVATMLKRWKLTLAELETFDGLTAAAQLLAFLSLPLDDAGAVASLERFLRTGRLLRVRDQLPETGVILWEVLEKLDGGTYAAAAAASPPTTAEQFFAADVALLNEDWRVVDVAALVSSLDLAFPADYLLAESWERLRRAFYFLDNLNAGADTAKSFAAAVVGYDEAKRLRELLRAKFGEETWLTLSTEIQDVLRERKRDSLNAYMLTEPTVRPLPADIPSGKWENENDLYAYYLLDVEMCSCMVTSRLVQGSGSVQLFVQRCHMGLEPNVKVNGDVDSAWRWWKWMRKYRVWEANRKVFLWPENWIEPELKKDRSQFFKDLENELQQNEIDQYNVEAAFTNYLEKLDGVAQLEIAGFYHEDDGDETIVHVFGRTRGMEPHIYYYRSYDYRQWTPWEKIDLDIQGDYLIPAVLERRLFLFWPVFTELPHKTANDTMTAPKFNTESSSSVNVPKTWKQLKLQIAVSEYRQGKWTPKRVSTDSVLSDSYKVEIVKKYYHFWVIDRSEIDGRFGIRCEGQSLGSDGNRAYAWINATFEIAGCKGVPVVSHIEGNYRHALRPEEASTGDTTGSDTAFAKYVEIGPVQHRDDHPQQDFTLWNVFAGVLPSGNNFSTMVVQSLTPILWLTPGIFRMTPPWQLSYMDKLWLDGLMALGGRFGEGLIPMGTWLPYFYNDQKRTFFVLPSFGPVRKGRGPRGEPQGDGDGVRKYYPDIKRDFRAWEDLFAALIRSWMQDADPSTLPPGVRQQFEQTLFNAFPEEGPPPYTDEQFMSLFFRLVMRACHRGLGAWSLVLFQRREFHFKNFYHPFVCDLARLVYNPLKGIPAMMSRETQLKNTGFSFKHAYQPTPAVVEPGTVEFYPEEVFDFTPDGAYSPYNWELFFHAPLLIANSLSRNQRFEEAHDWYHFIFNPIGVESAVPGGSAMSKYWITKPFFETTDPQYVQQRIDNIMLMLAGDTTVPGFSAQARKDLEAQVLDWRTNPFEPHRIANYRTVAYQKTVVMKYLDNVIAWGDYLFRQDSMESINEATQLYILAAEILGPPPKKIPPRVKPPVESFNELADEFDTFSNALVEVENLVPPLSGNDPDGKDPAPLPMLYFCIPHNDKMLGYWDTVADRLYKIRHCMNIEGVVRQLALFEPPIDPGALVKAVAGGLDISSALADLNAPLPLYRFNVLLQKANEVCNDVKALGGALLAALEKKDAEALGLLRQSHEIKLLEAVKAVREQQIEEAKENLEGVLRSKTVIETRRNFYRDIERVSSQERLHLDKLSASQTKQDLAQVIKVTAAGISIIPGINIGATGFGGSPVATFKIGGVELGQAAGFAADVLSLLSQIDAGDAQMASINAGHNRRWDEWKFQEAVANKELEQIEKSIAAAELRVALTEKELENHVLQIENAKATDAFMRSKYTNQELYQWQVGQISGIYFQSYRLAYDLAKRAERCFRFELGLQDSSYINFGYWDSLKKGLLSGEKLQYDLRRLETAYLEQNRREFEMTKHVSLALLDPLALVRLRETGRCFFRLPEEIFDLDFPGHYFRRIKSVSLTLPCVAGPYTTVSCTLRLLKHSIRVNTANGDNGYTRNADDDGLPADDTRFVENNIPVKAIAASSAQNDSGVFELNFRDERYLPFEGAGAADSSWSLELFTDLPSNNPDPGAPDFGRPLRQFDYGTISDAVVHLKYTAREDAGAFKNGAVTHLRDYFSQDGATPSLLMLNLRQDFPTQWHRFLHPPNAGDANVFELQMAPRLFPFRDGGKTLIINRVWLLARCADAGTYEVVIAPPLPPGPDTLTLARVNLYGGLHFSQRDVAVEIDPADPPVTWQLEMTGPSGNLQEDPVTQAMEVGDVFLVLGYEWE